ncbi:MAG: DUF2993 domain-containing protein [Gordonia sp. (in: high G+C Gram-positive bacteria)]
MSDNENTPPGTYPYSDEPAAEWIPVTERIELAPTDAGPRAYSDMSRPHTAHLPLEAPAVVDEWHAADPASPAPPVKLAPTGKRRAGKLVALVAAGLVVLLVIGLVAAELIVRKRVTDCLDEQFGALTGVRTNVALSRKPILLQGLGGSIPFVQVDTVDSGSTRLHLRADDVVTHGDTTTVGSLHGSGYVPFSQVVDLGNRSGTGTGNSNDGNGTETTSGLDGAKIASITGNPADGTIDVESSIQLAIIPVPISTTIKPVVTDGHIHFEVVKASAFIFGIPSDFAQRIVDEVSQSLFGPFFDEISIGDLKVSAQGVDFAVSGDHVTLTPADAGGKAYSCGSF